MEATIILDGIEYTLTPKEAVSTPLETDCTKKMFDDIHKMNQENKPKLKVIFVTRDGIDITALDTRIYIINNFFEIYEISAISYTANPLLKYFFNKDNRDEYALLNKPVSVTQKEILDYLQANHTKFSDEIIAEFFKEKINL